MVKLKLGVNFGSLFVPFLLSDQWFDFQRNPATLGVSNFDPKTSKESLIWSQTWVTKVVSDMKGNLFLKEDRFGGECPHDL